MNGWLAGNAKGSCLRSPCWHEINGRRGRKKLLFLSGFFSRIGPRLNKARETIVVFTQWSIAE